MTGFTGSEDYHYRTDENKNICLVCNNRTYSNSCPIKEENQTCIYCSPRAECSSWEPMGHITTECDPKNDCKYRELKLVCRFCVRNTGKRSIYDSRYRNILINHIKDMFSVNEYCCMCGAKIVKGCHISKGKVYCLDCERLAK